VLTTPVILMSVFHRSRDIHDRLFQSESDNQAKIQFLSQMSHELRTPLDIILGNAQLLTRQAAGSPLRREFLDHIQQSGWHLLSMIDEILDYSRGVAGHLPIENTRLNWPHFLLSLAHNAQVLADKNTNRFAMTNTAGTPSHVVTDGKRLRQVLDNLLTNASKHTRDGSIHLDCAAHEHNGQWKLSFAVTDSGEGIALADQKRIFLPFERGINRTQTQDKGIGMGLAIARQWVEAMGGQLSMQSVPGQGACFSFWIMADKADELADRADDTMGMDLKLNRVSGYTGACKSVLAQVAVHWPILPVMLMSAIMAWAQDLKRRSPESAAIADQLEAAARGLDLVTLEKLTACVGV